MSKPIVYKRIFSSIKDQKKRLGLDRKPGTRESRRQVKDRQLKTYRKRILVELMGGKCEICHGAFPLPAMDFHHITPKGSLYDSLGFVLHHCTEEKFWNEIVPKIRQECRLLCANCHRVEHHKS